MIISLRIIQIEEDAGQTNKQLIMPSLICKHSSYSIFHSKYCQGKIEPVHVFTCSWEVSGFSKV